MKTLETKKEVKDLMFEYYKKEVEVEKVGPFWKVDMTDGTSAFLTSTGMYSTPWEPVQSCKFEEGFLIIEDDRGDIYLYRENKDLLGIFQSSNPWRTPKALWKEIWENRIEFDFKERQVYTFDLTQKYRSKEALSVGMKEYEGKIEVKSLLIVSEDEYSIIEDLEHFDLTLLSNRALNEIPKDKFIRFQLADSFSVKVKRTGKYVIHRTDIYFELENEGGVKMYAIIAGENNPFIRG